MTKSAPGAAGSHGQRYTQQETSQLRTGRAGGNSVFTAPRPVFRDTLAHYADCLSGRAKESAMNLGTLPLIMLIFLLGAISR